MGTGLLLPDVDDADTAPFWAAARDRRLVAQKCGACGTLRLPAHPFCGACRAEAVEWVALSGRGRLWSFIVHHGPTLPAFAPHVPFPVIVAELAEDPRLPLVGNILAAPDASIDSLEPASLRIGMPLAVTFREVAPGVTLPMWLPA
ncbi:MAG: Zn-ribbon domain-containing OB-fold protein [Gammaproteobacteria bacterium]